MNETKPDRCQTCGCPDNWRDIAYEGCDDSWHDAARPDHCQTCSHTWQKHGQGGCEAAAPPAYPRLHTVDCGCKQTLSGDDAAKPETQAERRKRLSLRIQMLADEATTDEGYRLRERLEDEVMDLADALADANGLAESARQLHRLEHNENQDLRNALAESENRCAKLDALVFAADAPNKYDDKGLLSVGQELIRLKDALAEKERQVAALCQRCVDDEVHMDRIASLERTNAELKAQVELLEAECKAAQTRSGMDNVIAQFEAQLEEERAENASLLKQAEDYHARIVELETMLANSAAASMEWQRQAETLRRKA